MPKLTLLRKSHLAVGCLCAVAGVSVQAQSQSSINGTGGFVSACAYSNSGSGFNPGGNLPALFGSANCNSDTFSGNGSVTESATYNSGLTSNQSQGTVGLGTLHLSASNSAPNNSYFSAAGANGGWTETLVANAANQAGHAGVTVVALKVTGSLAAHGFAGASSFQLTGYKDKNQLTIYGLSGLYNYGSQSNPIGTDRQIANWSVATDYYYVSGQGLNDASATIDDTINFAIPVTLGQSFSFGVYGYALAGMRSASGVAGISTAGTDFSHTVTWGGVVGIYDSNGQLLSDYSLTSASGADWTRPFTAPVPEPESYAMMLVGLGLLRLMVRRKISA